MTKRLHYNPGMDVLGQKQTGTCVPEVMAAGIVGGSAGNAAATCGYLSKGVLYIYTHLTALLLAASTEFLGAVKR